MLELFPNLTTLAFQPHLTLAKLRSTIPLTNSTNCMTRFFYFHITSNNLLIKATGNKIDHYLNKWIIITAKLKKKSHHAEKYFNYLAMREEFEQKSAPLLSLLAQHTRQTINFFQILLLTPVCILIQILLMRFNSSSSKNKMFQCHLNFKIATMFLTFKKSLNLTNCCIPLASQNSDTGNSSMHAIFTFPTFTIVIQ